MMSAYLVDQGHRAKEWRVGRNLSRPALGSLIGYSPSQIECFESGRQRGTNKPIDPRDFLTYKLACAAVAAGVEFDWRDVTVTLSPAR